MKFIQAMIALLVSGLLGGWLGFHGASWAGMESSSGPSASLEPLAYLSIGLVTALIAFPLAMAALRRKTFRSRLVESMITSVFVQACDPAAGHRVITSRDGEA